MQEEPFEGNIINGHVLDQLWRGIQNIHEKRAFFFFSEVTNLLPDRQISCLKIRLNIF